MSSTAPVAALSALLVLAFLSVLTPCTAMFQWPVHEDRPHHQRTSYYTIEIKRNPSLSFDHRTEELRERRIRVKDEACCGRGYRSQWLSFERKRRVISYCPESLPCCSNLVTRKVEMWAGFGFTLCIKAEHKKKVTTMNPFTRYMYNEREEE